MRRVDMMPSDKLERLQRYRAEVDRGIVHTKAYDREMAEVQRYYDRLVAGDLADAGERLEVQDR